MKKQIKIAKDNLNDKDKIAYFFMVAGFGSIVAAIMLSVNSMMTKFMLMGIVCLCISFILYNVKDEN